MRRFLLLLGPAAVVASQWTVYLSPRPSSPSHLKAISGSQANLILAQHLGLEEFHALGDEDMDSWYNFNHQPSFFGRGINSGVLVSIESQGPPDFLPEQLSDPLFTVSHAPSISTLISTYTSQATHIYSSVFSTGTVETIQKRFLDVYDIATDSSAASRFREEISSMINFAEDSSESNKFGAFEIKSLDMLASEFGKGSDEYMTAVQTIKGILSHSAASGHNVALIVTSPSVRLRAEPSQVPFPAPNPHKAIFSSQCHVTAAACTNSTSECSGRGQCLEIKKGGRSCFACQCAVTSDNKGRKTFWAGNACQKKDVSSSFVLLLGSSLFVMFIGMFAIMLLYSVGADELPSTLTGGVVPIHRE